MSHEYSCYLCRDTGAVLARLVGAQHAPYAFSCLCPRGSRYKSYPTWAGANKQQFVALDAPSAPVAKMIPRLEAERKISPAGLFDDMPRADS